LIYNNDKKYIISTEHGPQCGDEVNLIKISKENQIPNYGWPISSYGDHYDGKFKKEAPLKKSHKEFGFIEPIKYFNPSIAISELVDVTDIFGNGINTRIFVSALGYHDQSEEGDQSIHSLILNDNFEVLNEDRIFIGERIRDIYKIKSKNIIILSLESSPSIGVLELLN
jgi:Glucose/sorbosone dehydrogenases